MDVLDRADLPFPHSLPEFQRLFPDDAACAAYLEKARWASRSRTEIASLASERGNILVSRLIVFWMVRSRSRTLLGACAAERSALQS